MSAMDDDDDVEPDNIPEQMLTEPPQHPDVRRRIRIQYRTLLNDVSSEYCTDHFNCHFLGEPRLTDCPLIFSLLIAKEKPLLIIVGLSLYEHC